MSEYITAAVVTISGIAVLALATVVTAIRGRGDRFVSWRGFGVVFEVRPCTMCERTRNLAVNVDSLKED